MLDTDKVRHHSMRELYDMNLIPATLFPDLDALARSLDYELEFHWAFDLHTGDLRQGYEWVQGEDGRKRPCYD